VAARRGLRGVVAGARGRRDACRLDPAAAAAAAEEAAMLELAVRLALHVLRAPRAGAELSGAALLAAALFLTISLPHERKTRLIGAKS
jgi:hypothetical protein